MVMIQDVRCKSLLSWLLVILSSSGSSNLLLGKAGSKHLLLSLFKVS